MQTSNSTGRRKVGPFWGFVGAVTVVGGILGVTLAFLPSSLPVWAVGVGWAVAGGVVVACRTVYPWGKRD